MPCPNEAPYAVPKRNTASRTQTSMPYDPERHHRRSIRLKGYDYTQAGAYFITIVTKDRACLFGRIVDGEMRLSRMGHIVRMLRLRQQLAIVKARCG